MRSLLGSAAACLFFIAHTAAAQDAQQNVAAAPPNEASGAAPGTIALELNKLVPADNACHAYILVQNQTPEPLNELKVDVYLFDKQEIILEGVALQFNDVPSERERVVPFELADLACDSIGRVLLNKVLVCTGSGGAPVEGCADRLVTSTRAEASFEH
jgi:hypothetical protein